jgi:hypothetical protein
MAWDSDNSSGGEGGFSSAPGMGSFKSANAIGGKLPAGGATIRGVGGLEQRAGDFSFRHSTKGLSTGPKPFTTKVRPVKNEMKSIGRKRGY